MTSIGFSVTIFRLSVAEGSMAAKAGEAISTQMVADG